MPGQTLSLLADLDDGPSDYLLEPVARRARTPILDTLLPFAKTFDEKCYRFTSLVDDYNSLAKKNKAEARQIVATAVVKWVFLTNKTEFAGLPTEGDTNALIGRMLSATFSPQSREEREVSQTYQILGSIYSPDRYLCSDPTKYLGLDTVKFKAFHCSLLTGIDQGAGHFRRCGAETTILDTAASTQLKHKYPHHSLIPHATATLCEIAYSMIKSLSSLGDRVRQVSTTFAIAAFVHLHLLDIHPFGDGNGRLTRLVSKLLLDYVSPLPFSVAVDRQEYIIILERCRQSSDPILAPAKLMEMMLDQAIRQFEEFLTHFPERVGFAEMVCGVTRNDVQRGLSKFEIAEEDVLKTLKAFDLLEDGQFRDVPLSTMVVRVKKLQEFVIDDI